MAGDGYTPEEPQVLHEFPLAIASDTFKLFLDKLIPKVLEVHGIDPENLVRFNKDDEGRFFMLFQTNTGEIRAICSPDPEWKRRVEAMVADLMGEKDLSDTFPRTDFEDIEPSDTPESKSR